MGNQEPSVRIAPEYIASDGMDACKILRAGGTVLDPWQALILDDWLGRTASGRWAAPTCGGSVPRQNGKSLLVQGRAEIGMLMFNEQVIYTAHLQKTATETFEEMRDFFESKALIKYVADIKTALGREQIILKSGARIKFLARTRNGGRGQHGDLLIIDEAQEMDEDAQASFLPAISASLNPQTVYVGTPPDPNASGVVFRGIRNRALAGKTERMAWFEFSVNEIGDVKDKKRWAATNPALGLRILPSTIEGECEQMDSDTFARERLGWWSPVASENVEYALDKKAWEACKSDEMKPEGKTAYGVKFTPDGAMVALCGAVIPDDGIARISLIDKIADTWKAKNSIIRPSTKDIMASAGMLSNAINEKTVTWYSKQEDLDHSATTSVKRPISGGGGFGGDNSAPIEAAALALWGVKTSKRNPNKQMRIG